MKNQYFSFTFSQPNTFQMQLQILVGSLSQFFLQILISINYPIAIYTPSSL
jgi:hypothetical protein